MRNITSLYLVIINLCIKLDILALIIVSKYKIKIKSYLLIE